jgi:hypothetical protein
MFIIDTLPPAETLPPVKGSRFRPTKSGGAIAPQDIGVAAGAGIRSSRIRKSGHRFSEQIMLKQEARA